ncbi:MAG: hypothetical protein V8T31_11060 [Lachnospiraceae bacterium]
MIELLEIKDFIQKIAEGITLALEIDTQIIDRYCNRIAGTVIQPLPPVGGVVRTILQTGLPLSALPLAMILSVMTVSVRESVMKRVIFITLFFITNR